MPAVIFPYQRQYRHNCPRLCLDNTNSLVPAVHARDGVGVDRERDVLMHPRVRPPNTLGVSISTGEPFDAFRAFHAPMLPLVIESDGRHELALAIMLKLPPSHVMATGNDARADALRDPGFHDKIANLGFYPYQVTGLDGNFRSI